MPSVSSGSGHTSLKNYSWLGWLSWSFQRVSLAGLPTRLLFLSLISLSNVFLGACLYRLASGQPWGRALFKTYGVLFRAPGIGVMNEDTLLASLVLNTIFIFGLFVFAIILSMISDELKQQLHAIRVGEVGLPLRGHVVVLNWNQQSPSLLKQLSISQADPSSRLFRRPVVVLAEAPKPTMDAAVGAVLKGSKLRIFCRSSHPTKSRDLERVAAEAADTVIILQPEPCSSKAAADALQATALVSLSCLQERADRHAAQQEAKVGRGLSWQAWLAAATSPGAGRVVSYLAKKLRWVIRLSAPRCSSSTSRGSSMQIVVQVQRRPSSSPQDDIISFLQSATASSLHGGKIQQVQLLSQSTLDRLVCQTAVAPGLATVFRELVRAGGEVHLAWCDVDDRLAGTYGRAAEILHGSVLLGMLAAESKQLTLNPPDQLMLLPGDRLVALTRPGATGRTLSSLQHSPMQAYNRTVSRVSSMSSPQLLDMKWSSSSGSASSGTPDGSSHSKTHATAPAPQQAPDRGLRLVVVGWQESGVPDLLLQLRGVAPRSSRITVMLPGGEDEGKPQPVTSNHRLPDAGKPQAQSGTPELWSQLLLGSVVSVVRVAQPSSMQALRDAGVAAADAVIVGPALSQSGLPATTEADALVTAALLGIQHALETSSMQSSCLAAGGLGRQQGPECASSYPGHQQNKLHVVAVVSSYSIRRALQAFLSSTLLHCHFSYELMVQDEFAASMLVLVAQDPANAGVIDQLLLQSSASTLGMWTLHKLGLDGDAELTFTTVRQAARQHKCTALGYRRADGRMVLAPSPGMTFLGAADRIVLLDGKRGHSSSLKS